MDQHRSSETVNSPSASRSTEMAQPPLAARLFERIRREGPITFRDWMEAALYDPFEGYYARPSLAAGHEPWGREGDYRTSPERSPLFAATFARYFAELYETLGRPDSWTILEAGAGAGHFAEGTLATLQEDHPRVFEATRYLIVEAGEGARERCRARLVPFDARVEYRCPEELDASIGACVVFSNELLDAFPVHRVMALDGQLRELYVGADESAGAFVWFAGEPSTPRLQEYLESDGVQPVEGQLAEINLAAEEWLGRMSQVLERGYIVTVDYGAEAGELYRAPQRQRGTLRAFHRHRLVENPLVRPGELDLTATINWTSIVRAGLEHGLEFLSLERQDRFLLRAGLLDQLERFTARARNEADALILRTSVRELILPGGMSDSFQVLVQKKL